ALRQREIPLRGVALRGKGERLKYGLNHVAEYLLAMEEYTQQPYPYDKLDIVAVPDFSAGAMENVGVMTFREVLILLDEGSASTRLLQSYHIVMAHELAHQWFGNSVTMPWW